MNILVTGGAGFVGTNLIKRLLRDGHEVTSVDNYSTSNKDTHQDGCRYYENDLSSDHILGIYVDHSTYPSWRDDEFDVIFHLAALARIQPSFEEPVETFKSNVVSTVNILELARKKNIPVIYAGSSTAHGDHSSNPYSFTKRQGELLCEMYNNVYNLPTVVTRFYNVYGDYQLLDGAYTAVIGIFLRQYSEGKALTITGDGEQRRDFTHVDDIVDGLVKSFENIEISSGKIFEFGSGVNYSINEIASFFKTKTKYIPKRPGEMDTTLCESVEARKLIGFNPKKDIKDYLNEKLF